MTIAISIALLALGLGDAVLRHHERHNEILRVCLDDMDARGKRS